MTDYSENMRGLLLKDAYERGMFGAQPPDLAVVTGAQLNQQLLTDRYDAQASYHVSQAGITLITDRGDRGTCA